MNGEFEPIVLKTAGHSQGNLACDHAHASCGDIEDGVGFVFSVGRPGGWVVSFEDLEKVYLAVKKYRDAA